MPEITTTYTPEKLGLWDRTFNRTKEIPVESGKETWCSYIKYPYHGRTEVPRSDYVRDFIIYHVIDRLTGGYKIEKRYQN